MNGSRVRRLLLASKLPDLLIMSTTAMPIDEGVIRQTLSHVMDPELGCNIIDLGLIYTVEIQEKRIRVIMSLTTPGCPMHESIACGVQTALLGLDGVQEVDVEIVWDPPWNPRMMTDAGRKQLGLG